MAIYKLGDRRQSGVTYVEKRAYQTHSERLRIPEPPVDVEFVYADSSEPKKQSAPRRRFDKDVLVKALVQACIVCGSGSSGWLIAQKADAMIVVGVVALFVVALSSVYFNRET